MAKKQKTDKKDEEVKVEEVNEEQVADAEMSEAAEQASAESEPVRKELEEARAQVSEFKDNWIRAQAEFQNYRKRVERDNDLMKSQMKGDIIKKILPALDDLERAMQNRPADDAWANGIELIMRKMQGILDGEGVKRIEAKGVEFDPNFHEAISHEPAEGVESGHVIDVVQNGYVIGDRVIRPALVRVAQ